MENSLVNICTKYGTIILAGIVFFLSRTTQKPKKSRKRRNFLRKIFLSNSFSKLTEVKFSSLNKHSSATFIGLEEKEDSVTKAKKLSEDNINSKDRIFFKMLKNLTEVYSADKCNKEESAN